MTSGMPDFEFDYMEGLGATGRAVWMMFAADHMDEPDELLQLRAVCTLHDTVDALTAAIADAGTLVKGQQGTTVLNSAITERRMTFTSISQQMKQLGYSPATDDPMSRSQKATRAAQARWSR